MISEMNPIIKLENVYFRREKSVIINDININLETGELTGIIGPNGAGKSTLLKLITNIIKPSSGKIFFNDTDISIINPKKLNQNLSYLPQNLTFNFPFKTLEFVITGRYPHLGWLQNENNYDIDIATEALKLVDMEDFKYRNILSLSGGEQQRVSIARIIAQQTYFLFLDEPISNLDIHHQLSTLKLLKTIANNNKGVYVVLHDIRLAYKYCDKVIVMNKGEILEHGNPREILDENIISSVFNVRPVIIKENKDGNIIDFSEIISN